MHVAEAVLTDTLVPTPTTLPPSALPIDRPRASGFMIEPIDVAAATAALKSLYAGDEAEQRETFEYLRKALNETRAAQGERPVYFDEPDHLA